MKRFSSPIGLIFVLISLLLAGCGTNEPASQSTDKETLSIYTTLYPLEYIATEIGGSHVEVESILPAGADAHTYEPTSKVMINIANADVFIYNGANMEAYAEKIKEALKNESVLVVEAANGVPLVGGSEEQHAHEEEGHNEDDHAHEEESNNEDTDAVNEEAHDHQHGDVDPHVWLDPIRAISLAENIKDTLVELKPEAQEDFENNFEDLKARLEKLDRDFHSKLESQANTDILVTHAGYGYWEHAYGINQVAISGVSPSDEPSQKQLEQVIEIVRERDIEYLLFEQNIKPSVANVIQQETGIKSLQLHNLATLTEENRNNDDDYFTLMYRNLDVLETVLK